MREDSATARIMSREELLSGWGHGWEESWWIGDDEEPETKTLTECVWIEGHLMTADGCDANAESEYWRDRYGKKYGCRVWRGDAPPTGMQLKNTPWT